MKKYLFSTFCLGFIFCVGFLQAQEPNLSGTISCSGVGMEGIVVSDGYNFTTTDAEGKYSFYSDKKNGYVFYILPSGYMPYTNYRSTTSEKIFPTFWQALNFPNTVSKAETHDFKLTVENNDSHIMLFAADPQVGNRSDDNDYYQYTTMFFPRMKEEIANAGSNPIYTTVLGDMSWDYYWTSQNYNLANYKSTIANNYNSHKMRHFHVMGNHDNDPSIPHGDNTDFLAAGQFRNIMGPNYYSYNIGKIHYIVLDDIVYLNNAKSGTTYKTGVVGERDYYEKLSDDQLAYLEKDLSYVTDKNTPIMICVHAPFWSLNSSFACTVFSSNNSSALNKVKALLAGYKTVHVLSGHRHHMFNIEPASNIMEHTLGAVGGNLWWGGYYSGHPTCKDGTPGGWEVFYINGTDISWQFHSLENNGNAQFRVIDGNTLKTFYNTNETYKKLRATYTSRQNFSQLENNAVIVNVFNYDPKWKVEVFEGSKSLNVTRWRCEDPFATMAYDIPRFEYYLKKNGVGEYTTDNAANMNLHMFKAIASSATSSITVKVTDRFGNTYTKTVTRPIECSIEGLMPGGEEMILNGIQQQIAQNSSSQIYSDGKGIRIEAVEKGSAQITTVDGKHRTVALSVGTNTIPVSHGGIYIVTINGKSTKLYVR